MNFSDEKILRTTELGDFESEAQQGKENLQDRLLKIDQPIS